MNLLSWLWNLLIVINTEVLMRTPSFLRKDREVFKKNREIGAPYREKVILDEPAPPKPNPPKTKKKFTMSFERIRDCAIEFFFMFAIGGAILFALYCGVRAMLADGKVDYCYVERSQSTPDKTPYVLYGHRQWREDRRMGYFETPLEAFELAKTIDCKVEDK